MLFYWLIKIAHTTRVLNQSILKKIAHKKNIFLEIHSHIKICTKKLRNLKLWKIRMLKSNGQRWVNYRNLIIQAVGIKTRPLVPKITGPPPWIPPICHSHLPLGKGLRIPRFSLWIAWNFQMYFFYCYSLRDNRTKKNKRKPVAQPLWLSTPEKLV